MWSQIVTTKNKNIKKQLLPPDRQEIIFENKDKKWVRWLCREKSALEADFSRGQKRSDCSRRTAKKLFLKIKNKIGSGGTRTHDQVIKSHLLYQLSYKPKYLIFNLFGTVTSCPPKLHASPSRTSHTLALVLLGYNLILLKTNQNFNSFLMP